MGFGETVLFLSEVVRSNWLAVLLSVVTCLVITYGLNIVERWKFRHIPGPSPEFIIGNLAELKGRNHWEVCSTWSEKYGKLYRWFNGRKAVVTISDPDLAQEVMLKKFRTFHNRELPEVVSHALPSAMPRMKANMVWAKDKDWASVRSAVQPFFHTQELRRYAGSMNRSVERLKSLLAEHAESGEPADMRKFFGAFALEVIGTSAYGVDFSTQTAALEEDPLVSAVTAMFQQGLFTSGLTLVMQCLPWLARVVGLLIRAMPLFSEAARKNAQQRLLTVTTAYVLLKNAEKRVTGKDGEYTEEEELPWGEARFNAKQHPYANTVPAEGSLPDLLMKGKHKTTGEPLDYAQMTSQTHVFFLAGYDTSANCLSYCIYLLAKNPEEQEKVIEEVDRNSGSEPLTHDDLEKFPYVQAVIDEALRLFPPAPGTHRVAEEDVQVGKYVIPKGTQVRINMFGMHRDPLLFPEPEVPGAGVCLKTIGSSGTLTKHTPRSFWHAEIQTFALSERF